MFEVEDITPVYKESFWLFALNLPVIKGVSVPILTVGADLIPAANLRTDVLRMQIFLCYCVLQSDNITALERSICTFPFLSKAFLKGPQGSRLCLVGVSSHTLLPRARAIRYLGGAQVKVSRLVLESNGASISDHRFF